MERDTAMSALKTPLWMLAGECHVKHKHEAVAQMRNGRWLEEDGLSSEKTILIAE